MSGVQEVIEFWFGPLDEAGAASAEQAARWWQKDAAFDQEVSRRFANLHRAARAGELGGWAQEPRGRLALILLLDQFSRNMFRGQPDSFAADPQARQLALEGIERGDDRALPTIQRAFLYMPLMHSEDLADQERAVELFAALRDQATPALREAAAAFHHYAELHRDIVRRFGRFPHRNAILGRASSDEERAFLAGPGSSF